MVLSSRERTIALVAGPALAAVVLYYLVVAPVAQGRAEREAQKATLTAKVAREERTVRQARQMGGQWEAMLRTGIQGDRGEAMSQVLHTLSSWAVENGVSLSLLRPDEVAEKTALPQIAFQAVGTGSMESIGKLLLRIRNATIPIRVTELQLASRTEGADDLSVQMRLTTVYMPGPRPATAGAGAASRPAEVPMASWSDYRVLTSRNIFLRDRSRPRVTRPRISYEPRTPYVRRETPRALLTGIGKSGTLPVAFLEDPRTGRTMPVGVGEIVDGQLVTGIAMDAIECESGGVRRRIAIGQDLGGSSPSSATSRPATQPGATTQEAPTSQPAESAGPAVAEPSEPAAPTSPVPAGGVSDIERRMRERRAKE